MPDEPLTAPATAETPEAASPRPPPTLESELKLVADEKTAVTAEIKN